MENIVNNDEMVYLKNILSKISPKKFMRLTPGVIFADKARRLP
jgi:hypothetical protein